MTVKNDLKKYKALYYEVKFLKKEIEDMYNTVKAVNYDEKTGKGGGDDLTLMIVTQILKRKNDFEKKLKRLYEEEAAILEQLGSIENAEIKRVMILRYIDFQPWEKIAKQTNYTERRVLQLHHEGLMILESQKKGA